MQDDNPMQDLINTTCKTLSEEDIHVFDANVFVCDIDGLLFQNEKMLSAFITEGKITAFMEIDAYVTEECWSKIGSES